ncbi:MAG TPA: tripartite tricarboxylate transporter substrate binding protein [Candidatus Binatia bacterium]|jgi:putative tricarboxylic transport membrane protein|nr:tripartite tricarboxylate transporter substrate binding protein [Candidatus Binatia bacterium]
MKRDNCSILIVGVALGVISSHPAWGQEFKPSKQIETVVHTGPGGGSDLLARAIAEMLQKEKLVAQRLQVVNKSGGGSAVAMSYLAEKKGETHTIGFFTGVWVTNPLTTVEATVTVTDLTPIVRLVLEPAVIAVKADSPYKNMGDFIDAAKKAPKKLSQSGGSVTGRDNLMRLLLQKATGAQWNFISFPSGGERLSNLLGGHVQMMVIEPQEASEQIRAGNLRVIASLTEKRLASLPNVPTIKEQGIDVALIPQARGVLAPPAVPRQVVQYWEGVFDRFEKSPSWRQYVEQNQFEDGYLKGPPLSKFFADLTVQMREVLKEAGAKVVR